MLNFAKVCCLCGAVALILAFGGAPAHAGLSTNCLATDGSAASLLVQVKDKKSKKKHDQESGLTECTIVGAGGGGGCKNGKWTCEKLSSGKKCCGCVPAKGTEASAPPKGETPGTNTSQDWVDTQNKAEGRFSVGTEAVPPAQ
jgi:hypothetical protein